ncbi:hypothetical protein [Pseudomonas fontis]|uniref:Uncharacterized protein n=1 Tax=Pseudomonas fontis TaxID=2942633 RepID=A0ABT5NV58_9PSED|nr:hypothetical protein [Pseudomonas fontis]MDD0974180.1 hypothetical protein [Pseudomonas fontis]MDD0992060.1 hypothetical protein [Pseudomonas fontis]
MIGLIGYGSAANMMSVGVVVPGVAVAVTPIARPVEEGIKESLSSLAKQLSAAVARAEQRDSSLSRDQLFKKAEEVWSRLQGITYTAYRELHDAEVPSSGDPERLARAEAATIFMHGKGSNPFSGLSPKELAAIAYDESGDFTVNERNAALSESYRQQSEWNQKIAARMRDESAQTGQIVESLKEILGHYQGMPAIELARYGMDVIQNTQRQIDEESLEGPTSTAKMLTLFELLSKQRLNPPDSSDEQQAADKAPLPSAGPQR